MTTYVSSNVDLDYCCFLNFPLIIYDSGVMGCAFISTDIHGKAGRAPRFRICASTNSHSSRYVFPRQSLLSTSFLTSLTISPARKYSWSIEIDFDNWEKSAQTSVVFIMEGGWFNEFSKS